MSKAQVARASELGTLLRRRSTRRRSTRSRRRARPRRRRRTRAIGSGRSSCRGTMGAARGSLAVRGRRARRSRPGAPVAAPGPAPGGEGGPRALPRAEAEEAKNAKGGLGVLGVVGSSGSPRALLDDERNRTGVGPGSGRNRIPAAGESRDGARREAERRDRVGPLVGRVEDLERRVEGDLDRLRRRARDRGEGDLLYEATFPAVVPVVVSE